MFPSVATLRTVLILGVAGAWWLLPLTARAQAIAGGLTLQISPQQPFTAEPAEARIVLHLHNSSSQAVWLYRRAQAKLPPQDQPADESQPASTTGSSTVQVALQPAGAQAAQSVVSPAQAATLEYVLMPKPRLIRLAAGGDYTEVSILHLAPALAAGQKPIWGAYRLTATYGASFSNGGQFPRNLGALLWQGEVTSNTIGLELRPPLPDSTGTVSGSTLDKNLQPFGGVRVSLQNEDGELIDQQVTGGDGRFSFAHLPVASYWITGRREDATEDTVTFHHEVLSGAAPAVTDQLVFFPQEIYDAKKLVHKPVLLRVFDGGQEPMPGVGIDALFSNGEIIDDVKATTADDGTAAVELIPGRSSVTLSRHGCQDQSERIEIAPGPGVDSSRFVFSCEKK